MTARMAFTKPGRARLARLVADRVEKATGVRLAFSTPDGFEDELHAQIPPGFETIHGALFRANFEVCPRGLTLHARFDDVKRASLALGCNPHSGKWNHYLWFSDVAEDVATSLILAELRPLLRQLAPSVGAGV